MALAASGDGLAPSQNPRPPSCEDVRCGRWLVLANCFATHGRTCKAHRLASTNTGGPSPTMLGRLTMVCIKAVGKLLEDK